MIPTTISLIPIKTKRRSGIKNNGIKFIVAHDTGNPNTTAKNNVNYFRNSANDMSASAHYFVDDIDVIICIPEDEKAWHVWYSVDTDNKLYNADANDSSIGVELCYFPNDRARTQKAYDNYVVLIKELFRKYKTTNISGHFQLDPTRKVDPMNAFKIIGKTWDMFIKDLSITPPTTEVFTYKFGDRGDKVKTLQLMLSYHGFLGQIDGIYGNETDKAFKLFIAKYK